MVFFKIVPFKPNTQNLRNDELPLIIFPKRFIKRFTIYSVVTLHYLQCDATRNTLLYLTSPWVMVSPNRFSCY